MGNLIETKNMPPGYLFWYEETHTVDKIMMPVAGSMAVVMGILGIVDLIINFSGASIIGMIVWTLMICWLFALTAFLFFYTIRTPWSEEITIDRRSIKEWKNGKMVREAPWQDIRRIEFKSLAVKSDISLLRVDIVLKEKGNYELFGLTNAKAGIHREIARVLTEEAWKRNIPFRDEMDIRGTMKRPVQ